MPNNLTIPLPDRGILAIEGPDTISFLQGLLTQDMRCLSSEHALYSALLTPQGRYLYDFFLVHAGEPQKIYIDVHKEALPELIEHLKHYRLRSILSFTGMPWPCWACIGPSSHIPAQLEARAGSCRQDNKESWMFIDPRTPKMGVRGFGKIPQSISDQPLGTWEDYNTLRLTLGIPDRHRELIPRKSIILENRLDSFNAIDWDKGCYLGQELNARTYHQGHIRKKLFPLILKGPEPDFDAPITYISPSQTSHSAGRMRSSQGEYGLGLLIISCLELYQKEGGVFQTNNTAITPILFSEEIIKTEQDLIDKY